MKINITLLFCFYAVLASAQSNWVFEGEVTGALLIQSQKNWGTYDVAPSTAPTPFSAQIGLGLYRKILTNFHVGLGCSYQPSRNANYSVRLPISVNPAIDPIEQGYLRRWDYISIPLLFKYNIKKQWGVLFNISNSFLLGKTNTLILKQKNQNNGQETWTNITDDIPFQSVTTTSNDRFHTLGLGMEYGFKLKNGHNLLFKGFYDYVILSSATTSTDNEPIPNQFGIGLVYQIPNLFKRKIK